MNLKPTSHTGIGWRLLLLAGLASGVACSEGRDRQPLADGGGVDGGGTDGGAVPELSVKTSSAEGWASLDDEGTSLFVVDAVTQRQVAGARIEAVRQTNGYLLRSSREDAYEPQVIHVPRGSRRAIALEPQTPAIRSRTLRPSVRLQDQDWLATTDAQGVAALTQGTSSVMFLSEGTVGSEARTFHVYRAPLPQSLIAVASEGPARPTNGSSVEGVGRVVSVHGARRARGGAVGAPEMTAGRSRALVPLTVRPRIAQLRATPTGVPGVVLLQWSTEDPQNKVVAYDVGVNSVAASKRLARTALEHSLTLAQGQHYACLEPLFEGSEDEPQTQCVSFTVQNGAAAPNLRVSVRRLSNDPLVANASFPVEVTAENTGAAAAAGFDVRVGVSNDATPAGGVGEFSRLAFDGLAVGASVVKQAQLKAAHDGHLFVVAEVDPAKAIVEANANDNVAHHAITVAAAAGRSRAPVLSLATPARRMRAAMGQTVTLQAFAHDAEDGDLSAKIVWTSSIDGVVGRGAELTSNMLSPGAHRIRASVADNAVEIAKSVLKDPQAPPTVELSRPAVLAMTAPGSTEVVAEVELVVSTPGTFLNTPPSVSAGPDVATTVGVAVKPFASAFDGDGQPLTFAWYAFDPEGAPIELASPTSLVPSLVPRIPGVYLLRLSVSDGISVANDEVQVTVAAPVTEEPSVNPAGLVAHLPFDATAGSVAVDASGNGNDGTVVAGAVPAPVAAPSWMPGVKAGGLALDGVSQYVRVPSSPSLNSGAANQSFSVSAWVFTRNYTRAGENQIVSQQEVGTSYDQMGVLLTDGYPTARVHFFSTKAAARIAQNQWVNLAAIYDGTQLRLYVNGALANSLDIGWPLGEQETPVLVGASQKANTVGSFFNGSIDEVRVYSRPLTEAEAALLAK